jgi:hypothetical protein
MRKTTGDSPPSQSSFGLKIAFTAIMLAVIGSIIVLSWVPPVSRDALTHHLAVPKLFLQQGAICEIPDVIFSYYPMNLDLLYMIPLYFGNDIIPKFIHFAFALLTAWLILVYLRRRLPFVWAAGGAIFFLTLPIIVKLSITVYVDLGLVFFSTASLMSLFKWIENRFQLKYLIVSGLCCGCALGTKYNALILLFLLTAFVPLLYIHRAKPGSESKGELSGRRKLSHHMQAVGSGILFCLIALIVFSPWMIRNYIWTANPVYPLYNSYFNPPEAVADSATGAGLKQSSSNIKSTRPNDDSSPWGSFAIRKVIYNEAWWQIALIPVRIFFQGRDDDPRLFDGKLNPFLFLLPLFAFFQLKTKSNAVMVEKKVLLWFAILFILYAYLKTDMRIRYIAPAIPPLVILATFGFYQIYKFFYRKWSGRSGPRAQVVAMVLAAVIFIFNGLYIIHQFKVVDPFSYISGRVGRDAYITRYRPEYTIIRYANRHLGAESKILALFLGNRRYYSDRDLVFANNLFRNIIKNSDTAQGARQKLQRRGFTHIVIRYDLFNQWTDKQFSNIEKMRLKTFFARDARQVLSRKGYGLFQLADNL